MNTATETIVVTTVIALACLYLYRKFVGNRKAKRSKSGCNSNCGCSTGASETLRKN